MPHKDLRETALVTTGLDTAFYRSCYPDLAEFNDDFLRSHYETHGRNEGRIPFGGAARESFLKMVPRSGLVLEIGPFARPSLDGAHVRYADVMSATTIKSIAAAHGMDPALCPTIHYLLTETPLEAIPERFTAVFSSHCIEHQPDLIGHFQAVSDLLEPGGSYFLIVPDKRYCFDHFRSESTIGDIATAYVEKRKRHDLRSFISHNIMMTHNDSHRHWAGDHGEPVISFSPTCIDDATRAFRSAKENYLDTHAWQFTPKSFDAICSILYRHGLTRLKPLAIYPTLFNRNEFCAILALN